MLHIWYIYEMFQFNIFSIYKVRVALYELYVVIYGLYMENHIFYYIWDNLHICQNIWISLYDTYMCVPYGLQHCSRRCNFRKICSHLRRCAVDETLRNVAQHNMHNISIYATDLFFTRKILFTHCWHDFLSLLLLFEYIRYNKTPCNACNTKCK